MLIKLKKKIKRYKKENGSLIQINQAKKEEDERKLDQRIKQDEREKEEKKTT